jgi:pyridoxal phosphate enzyme (YggS family)
LKKQILVKFSENDIKTFLNSIPPGVKVVAVSKTKPVEDILAVYNTGHKIFGENRVQELTAKYEQLPRDIEWHLIGHLQSNKVKYISKFVHLIHSIDSLKLLTAVNQEALKTDRIIDVLFQVYIAKEETKFGLDKQELIEILTSPSFKSLGNVRIRGLMGIATFTENMDQVRSEFRILKEIFDYCKHTYFGGKNYFSELSMGMSCDYKIAIEEGATIIRVGSLLFGERNYL